MLSLSSWDYYFYGSRDMDLALTLTLDGLKELEFWKNCFEKFNGQPIWTVNPICSVTSYIYLDFSEYGWGGYTVNISGLLGKGDFSEGED